MIRSKNGNRSKILELLEESGDVPTVPAVPAGLDGHHARARERVCVNSGSRYDMGSYARARHDLLELSGNSGNSGNTPIQTASSKRESAVPTFSGASGESGNSGNSSASPLTDRPSLNAALLLPVRHLVWLPARLTYRFQRPDGTPVVWTSHPGVYGALTGPQGAARGHAAAFSPKEFEAAVSAGESGVATEREFAAWVATKLAAPGWRLGAEEALRWTPRGRLAGFGWWPGSEPCDAHEVERERGWTVGFACAAFNLTPVSIEVHPADHEHASPRAAV